MDFHCKPNPMVSISSNGWQTWHKKKEFVIPYDKVKLTEICWTDKVLAGQIGYVYGNELLVSTLATFTDSAAAPKVRDKRKWNGCLVIISKSGSANPRKRDEWEQRSTAYRREKVIVACRTVC